MNPPNSEGSDAPDNFIDTIFDQEPRKSLAGNYDYLF